jgi:two-component system, OmpR family, sensor histidine kinase KdpD
MKPSVRIGIAVAGAAGVAGMASFRKRVLERSGCAQLERLTIALPQCRKVGEMLELVEQAFRAATGLPSVILLPDGGQYRMKPHDAGFDFGAEQVEGARSAMSSGLVQQRRHRNGSKVVHFLPLATLNGVLGVLAFESSDRPISRQKWASIRSIAAVTSMALLRAGFQEQAQHARALSEADGFQKVLLNSIAHNVRTPLASIIGVLSTLQEDGAVLDEPTRSELVDTARQEAERLNRLLGNLLDLSRIESGAVHVRADPCDVPDVVGAALEQLGVLAQNRPIYISIPPDLGAVPMDFGLIVQVLVNLLENAIKYSTGQSPVHVEARRLEDVLTLRISDEGDGIPEADLALVFEKFNRAGRSGETGGIGLGLSICRGLIEAHHGKIWAERRDPRGTAVTFSLPLRSP